MRFENRALACQECGEEFIFSADEQLFFSYKAFLHDPKRCPRCRGERSKATKQTAQKCAACGADTIVPFNPKQGRPVFCRKCLNKLPAHSASAGAVERAGIEGGLGSRAEQIGYVDA